MKAAVLHAFGEAPHFEDFPDPIPCEGEILVQVKAVALENIDKAMAKGTHYAVTSFSQNCPRLLEPME